MTKPRAADEDQIRDEKLDETIENTFPASDPPSTIPNPDGDSSDDPPDTVDQPGPKQGGRGEPGAPKGGNTSGAR